MQPVTSSITATNTGLFPRLSTLSSMGSTSTRGSVPTMSISTSRRAAGIFSSLAPRRENRAANPRKNSVTISTMSFR